MIFTTKYYILLYNFFFLTKENRVEKIPFRDVLAILCKQQTVRLYNLF